MYFKLHAILHFAATAEYISTYILSFKCRIIPSVWQNGVINSIPKSGNKDVRLPLNCRGITLTCHMYKVYCTILNVRLSTFLEKKKILVEEQNGFRKMRSCLDHIITLVTTIESRYKRRQSTKLSNIGVNGNI